MTILNDPALAPTQLRDHDKPVVAQSCEAGHAVTGLLGQSGESTTLELFHGTAAVFDRFRAPSSGVHFGPFDQAAHAATLALARAPLAAFESLPKDESGFQGVILRCRVELVRWKRVKDARNPGGWARAIAAARRQGYTALVYRNEWEGREAADSVVIFDPNHVAILGRANPARPQPA